MVRVMRYVKFDGDSKWVCFLFEADTVSSSSLFYGAIPGSVIKVDYPNLKEDVLDSMTETFVKGFCSPAKDEWLEFYNTRKVI